MSFEFCVLSLEFEVGVLSFEFGQRKTKAQSECKTKDVSGSKYDNVMLSNSSTW